MFTQQDSEHLASLRSQTEQVLRDTIGEHKDVALLDAPALVNVGDSLIWAGQLAYMDRLGYRVRYVSDMQSFDERRLRKALPAGGTILLRGGGNFGDVWVGHQEHRERIAKALPEYKIVQLTQSVLFKNADRAKKANEILGAHPDFHLLVRDELSLERASEHLPDIDRTPCLDMAIGWDPKPDASVSSSSTRAVVIAREDREGASGLAEAARSWQESFDITVTDWGRHADVPARWHRTRKELKFNRKLLGAKRKISTLVPALPQSAIERRIAYLNDWNVDSAVNLFSTARGIAVDRLHAHVIAARLGIPHVVLDNNHGKISTVFHAYTGQFSSAHYATSTDEAHEKLLGFMTS
ncbi:exopolysaccharide biosynthesis protein [Microbacterium nanhaiense]|uniref:Exopolysaccharide biosynthesis protein n=1 Tax=Microbacterium nanhaiense TaxID=1301026 RepID=A0ABQ2MWN8_9MICO|nr:polysaccharide pyruvyl transferase family protein [Microbacterium nanhaiense]GGO59170.1 exopolysaccharide biosynthesis protein [Microbacterium nanhaiense]